MPARRMLGGMCAILLICCMASCARPPFAQRPAMQEMAPPAPSLPSSVIDTVRVAYDPNDTLNPYTLRTQVNRDLLPLLYDTPVRLSPTFQPENLLAESVTCSGKTWRVVLRAGVCFSDQSPLRAQDVAYSFGLCRQDARYANVISCTAQGARSVVFELAMPDAFFANLLTFPVIPEDSGEQSMPPGTGRYCMLREDGNGRMLLLNEAHFLPPSNIKTIRLVEIESVKEIEYRLISSQIDLALLEPDASPLDTVGSFPVQTNNMIYLGFNTMIFPTDTPAFRQAVDLLIDRGMLVGSGCAGNAAAASFPVNPSFLPKDNDPVSHPEQAEALLDSIGITRPTPQEMRTHEDRELELQLALNMHSNEKREIAALLKTQLESAGIRVALNDYAFEQFKTQITSGGYSMYLGETRLPEDMSLTALLNGQGTLHYALGDTQKLWTQYLSARADMDTYAAFLDDLRESSPFIPLLFGQSMLSHSKNFYSTVVATRQDIFYNIHKW